MQKRRVRAEQMVPQARAIKNLTGTWPHIKARARELQGEWGDALVSLQYIRDHVHRAEIRRKELEKLGFPLDSVPVPSTSKSVAMLVSWLYNQLCVGVCLNTLQRKACTTRCTFKHEIQPLLG